MSASREQLRQLAAPFAPQDIEWRVAQSGEKNGKVWAKVLAYLTNRAIMERLDTIVGPENWKNTYEAGPAGGILCGISIRITRDDGASEWVTKWDGAENTDVEAVKGGLSSAMKRSAVMWGCGRYLYDLDEGWANVHEGGAHSAKTKDGKWFKWDAPTLPAWALPKTDIAPTLPAAPRMTAAQHTQIETLLVSLDDETIATKVRAKVAKGLTRDAADEAIRYLKTQGATVTQGGAVPAPGKIADALVLTSPDAVPA